MEKQNSSEKKGKNNEVDLQVLNDGKKKPFINLFKFFLGTFKAFKWLFKSKDNDSAKNESAKNDDVTVVVTPEKTNVVSFKYCEKKSQEYKKIQLLLLVGYVVTLCICNIYEQQQPFKKLIETIDIFNFTNFKIPITWLLLIYLAFASIIRLHYHKYLKCRNRGLDSVKF